MTKSGVIGAILATVSFGALAHAEAPKVDITSFFYVGDQTRVAELCGKVTGMSTPSTLVRVTVDENYKPGIYNTLAGQDGKFCTLVLTYTGRASAAAGSLTASAIAGTR